MTEGMQRLWDQKIMVVLCLILGFAKPSKALFIWVIIASFVLLCTKMGTVKSILVTFGINFLLVVFFPAIYS